MSSLCLINFHFAYKSPYIRLAGLGFYPQSQKMISGSILKLSEEEIREFEAVYPEIVKCLVQQNDEEMPDMELATDCMVKLMDYNVPKGKRLRGLMVPLAYRTLVNQPTKEDMRLAFVLGWCLEIMQGACLIADDIMDQSETRRGQPCWYKLEDVGLLAVNDTFILANTAHKIIQMFFSKKRYYIELVDSIRDVIYKTVFGQSMDCNCHIDKDKDKDMTRFSAERYAAIVKYKTSFYTMYLPIRLAMIMSGKCRDKGLLQKVENICLVIGNYFQVQDDFLDCFGDEQTTGKTGTDIQDNKCTWLAVKALESCNERELKLFQNNYGYDDGEKVEKVKALYRSLGLEKRFDEFEQDVLTSVQSKIDNLPIEIPKELFSTLLIQIYKRRK